MKKNTAASLLTNFFFVHVIQYLYKKWFRFGAKCRFIALDKKRYIAPQKNDKEDTMGP